MKNIRNLAFFLSLTKSIAGGRPGHPPKERRVGQLAGLLYNELLIILLDGKLDLLGWIENEKVSLQVSCSFSIRLFTPLVYNLVGLR